MKNAWLWSAVALAGLGLLYAVLKPAPPAPAVLPATEAHALQATATPRRGAALRQEFAMRIADGRLASAPPGLQVLVGTEVTLRLQSDRPDQLHVHGYELSLALGAGVPGSLTFVADRSGRFELEMHEAQLALGALEVLPQP